jgi:hypothetical protein
MSHASILLALALFFCAPAARAQTGAESRDLGAIREEQALLERQLQRLEDTMEILLARIEAEGRTRTAELLREGLKLLSERVAASSGALTLDERMAEVQKALESGQLAQSLEAQKRLVADLDRLVSILLDRKNLESLEQKIENLQKLQAELEALADHESKLRENTAELRQQAGGPEQRALEQALSELAKEQRELLAANERAGREAGTLALEQLEKSLQELLAAQRTDRAVLEDWEPSAAEDLAGAERALAEAQRAEARGARLEEAGARLERAAQALDAGRRTSAELAAELREAAESARRYANVSKDEAAEQSAQALERAQGTLDSADPAATMCSVESLVL